MRVADDPGRKRDAYAAAGLPEYWVVDLGARALRLLSARTARSAGPRPSPRAQP